MNKEFDLIAIGGGSGGVATVIKAAQLGARCAIVEANLWGGTCVNVGCVPKKIMWVASELALTFDHAKAFGFNLGTPEFNWRNLVQRRQAFIEKLHYVYQQKLQKHQVTMIKGQARFIQPHTIQVNDATFSAKHIVIATGGKPRPCQIPGREYAIDSDGFFALKDMPKRVAVVGAGYIAIELAGILHALGAETLLVYRYANFLRKFDEMIQEKLKILYQQQGIALLADHIPSSIESTLGKLSLHCENSNTIPALDCIIWATGRHPCTQSLDLDKIGIQCSDKGAVIVDAQQQSNIEGIYAIGDVTAKKNLTPVAIAQGRRLAARLFGQGAKPITYPDIPSVVFSHPPIGTVGLTEAKAREKYGEDIRIYQTQFTPLSHVLHPHPLFAAMKLITIASSGKIVGCHLIGDHVDEMLQGFAVAIHMGATKADFDDTIAIHPTVAEELVTLV